jgi:tRNA A37 threonylcarbamoyltransferase TsaD
MFSFAAQVVQKALDDAKLSESDLSAVAVTIGPGLSLCLRGVFFFTSPSFIEMMNCLFCS